MKNCYTRREMIKDKLLKEGFVRTSELSKEFSVSKNTILNDMRQLTQVFDIESREGRNGGYFYKNPATVSISAKMLSLLIDAMPRDLEVSDDLSLELETLTKLAAAARS